MKASTRASVVRTAVAARFAAAVLVAMAAARLAVTAALGAVHASTPELPSPGVRAASSTTSAPPAASSSRAVRAQAAASAGTPGKPVRMNLVVTVAGRSEIYVNDFLVGKSPYIGDVACKVGKPVTIEVVPAKGESKIYKRGCFENGTIRVGD